MFGDSLFVKFGVITYDRGAYQAQRSMKVHDPWRLAGFFFGSQNGGPKHRAPSPFIGHRRCHGKIMSWGATWTATRWSGYSWRFR